MAYNSTLCHKMVQ